jgi:hypothetical protein
MKNIRKIQAELLAAVREDQKSWFDEPSRMIVDADGRRIVNPAWEAVRANRRRIEVLRRLLREG